MIASMTSSSTIAQESSCSRCSITDSLMSSLSERSSSTIAAMPVEAAEARNSAPIQVVFAQTGWLLAVSRTPV